MKILVKLALFVFISAHAIQISQQYLKSDSEAEIKSILKCDGCNGGGRDRGGRDRGGRDRGDR